MKTDIKVINVEYDTGGQPDKKQIGWELLTWLQQGYRLAARDEILGEKPSQHYTVLTFAKDAAMLK